jgi:HD-GYP domain-containing protein (c-di-GMP phosphodiesterase class II)/HAMP domain-containing protein
MRLPSFSVEGSFLNSRVAQRVFWSVSIASLLPIAAFALFSTIQVRGQLEADAASALRSNLKESAVAIIGRLRLADESLQLRIRRASNGMASEAPASTRILRTVRIAGPGDPDVIRLLTGTPLKNLQGRRAVVIERRSEATQVLLLRGAPSGPAVWIAELDPDFVFEPERYSERDRFTVRGSDGRLIFSSHRDAPGVYVAPALSGVSEARADGFLTVSRLLILPGGDPAETDWVLSVGRSISDIQRPLREFEAIFPWVVSITLCVALGLALAQTRRILIPIDALTSGAERIANGDFDEPVRVKTGDEFESLSESFNLMTTAISEHMRVLNTTNEIGAALSAESSSDRLIELILTGSMKVTGGTAGIMFLLDDAMQLEPALAIVNGEALHGESSAFATDVRDLAARCLERRTMLRTDHREDRGAFDVDTWCRIEERLGASVSGSLVLPMSTEKREPVGAVVLLRTDARHFSEENAAVSLSLASQAAVAVQKNRLVESFRSLFEGIVDLTVRAIDEKSAYTGDHCRKVPILTEMIADAACDAITGPLKDVELNAEERYELKIAALLHDCGKVVTPVHVMDKAIKLETISDRIEVVEARFEILRADMRFRALERQPDSSGTKLSASADREFMKALALLDDDLEFVRCCNHGEEWMSDEDCDRIRAIAARHSWVDSEGQARSVLDEDDVANLTIRRGTLNDAERAIIEEHVSVTIRMLEALPWPREMRGVPAIAGAHHERVDGGGYPLGLSDSQLSVQARILALADVFEALTAKSRPYKPGRTLTETLSILDEMASEGYIDAGLYELFLQEKIHLKYSVEHVAPGQIDGAHQAMVERLTNPIEARGDRPDRE